MIDWTKGRPDDPLERGKSPDRDDTGMWIPEESKMKEMTLIDLLDDTPEEINPPPWAACLFILLTIALFALMLIIPDPFCLRILLAIKNCIWGLIRGIALLYGFCFVETN